MNEGHSAFLILELIKNIIREKKVSFEVAKDIASSKTVFTTHTPVPAGNDIFEIGLVEKYFNNFWPKLGLSREEFLRLGMKDNGSINQGFNMGVLAIKMAGKKNGVSKLHGEVSRELFTDVWTNIADEESPITYVTNGIHTCSWLAPNMKRLFNDYFAPYWQDKIHLQETWDKVDDIPDEIIWEAHLARKQRLMKLIKQNVTERFVNNGVGYDQISEVLNSLNINDKKVLIVVKELDDNLILASRNLSNIILLAAEEINVLDIVATDVMVVTEEALKEIEEVLK